VAHLARQRACVWGCSAERRPFQRLNAENETNDLVDATEKTQFTHLSTMFASGCHNHAAVSILSQIPRALAQQWRPARGDAVGGNNRNVLGTGRPVASTPEGLAAVHFRDS
jgi:hypothetical protein